MVMGKMEDALVLLGSGTPSVQSFHNAKTGRYQLLTMPERIENRPLPDVQIVDMKTDSKGDGKNGIISPPLKKALDQNLVRVYGQPPGNELPQGEVSSRGSILEPIVRAVQDLLEGGPDSLHREDMGIGKHV